MKAKLFTPTEGRKALRREIKDALPIVSTRLVTINAPGRSVNIPIVQLNAKNRPDVRDLARVHRSEGGQGDTVCQWSFPLGPSIALAILDVELQCPVCCKFKVAFDLRKHRALLEAIVMLGGVVITTSPLVIQANGTLRDAAIVYQTPTNELQGMLALTGLFPVRLP